MFVFSSCSFFWDTLYYILIFILYRRDRQNVNVPNATRADRNKLLRPTSASSDNSPDEDETHELKYEPQPAVRDLCSTTDAFIFVVDSSVPVEESKSFSNRTCHWI